MGKTTNIQWCDSTVNPLMGCTGCELWTASRKTCYAGQLHEKHKGRAGFARDFGTPKIFPGRMAQAAAWSDLTGTDRPDKPWLNGTPRTIFLSDMGDLFSEIGVVDQNEQPLPDGCVSNDFLKTEVVDVVRSDRGRRHRWLWLTKRPLLFSDFQVWLKIHHGLVLPSNLWLGTSITAESTLKRVFQLLQVGEENTTRFVSAEPLWGEVSVAPFLPDIDWLIVGGESTQGSAVKEFRLEWARKLRGECADAAVPFFVKQLGSFPTDEGQPLQLKDSHSGDWSEWPADLRIRQVPGATEGKATVPDLIIESQQPVLRVDQAFVRMSDIEPESLQWLWQNRIPLGHLTVIDGDPGCGKSSVTLDLAARVTTGKPMPDGTASVKGCVLILAEEDDVRSTLIFRLQTAGADLHQVVAVQETLSIPADLHRIEDTACKLGARLVIIDPLMAFLSGNANKDQSIRQSLSPLRRVADRQKLALVLVRHLNKSGGGRSLYRGAGSIGIIGAARSGLLVGRHPEDEHMRVLSPTKNNLGPLAPSLLFEPVTMNGVVRIEWRGMCEYTADALLTVDPIV
jgi:protein gp37